MKQKKILISLILVFALLLGGASALYKKLGKDLTLEQLVVQKTKSAGEIQEGTEPQTVYGTEVSHESEVVEEEPVPEGQAQEEQIPETEDPQSEGLTYAPDFAVYDRDGNEVRLSEYIGKPIVLNFWASWCGPCQSEMPDFSEKYLEIGGETQFLMVNMTDGARETKDSASAFIAENGYEFPVFFDTTGEAAIAYGAYSLPMTFFINADGYVIAQATGAINAETLQKGIDMIH